MRNSKYLASVLSPLFKVWWVRNNGLNPMHFCYSAEELRKRLEWMDNGYIMIPYAWFLCFCGMASNTVGSHPLQPPIFFGLSAVVLVLGLFLFIKNKLFFRNHTLLELARAWRGALWTFTDVRGLRKITQDGSVETIRRAINKQLLDWAVQSLKWKAVGETNSKRSRNLVQKIENLVALSKKCKLGCYQLHEVWNQAKFELDNPKQNPELM